MRRLLPLVCALGLVFTPARAEAGPGAILKLLTKAGKGAAKAGKGAGAVGKGLKGGAALKGAKVLGVTGAAEAVFRHAPTSGARVGLFVADDGAGALKVVTEAGEQMTHSADDLGRMVDDLDAMAEVAPDAGVDLFLDPDALHRLADLELGPNTRLFLANTEGASLPIRQAADAVPEVAVAVDRAGRGRFWLKLTTESAELALRLATASPEEESHLVVADGQCAPIPGVDDVAPSGAELLADVDGMVVVLTEDPVSSELIDAAQRHEVDLVALQLDVCPVDSEEPTPEATAAIARHQAATTVGELWAIAATASSPLVVQDAVQSDAWLTIRGAGLAATHQLATFEEDDEPPVWFTALVGLGMILLMGWWYWPRSED